MTSQLVILQITEFKDCSPFVLIYLSYFDFTRDYYTKLYFAGIQRKQGWVVVVHSIHFLFNKKTKKNVIMLTTNHNTRTVVNPHAFHKQESEHPTTLTHNTFLLIFNVSTGSEALM